MDSILKSRAITLPTKVHLVKAMVFLVVMYGCESWTVKKAEHRRTDAFEPWCWRRLLKVPWTARRSNQSNWFLKESVLGVHWKDWCWSWNSNTLATSCEELTHWKRPWCWEGLGAGGEGATEDEMVGWHHWLDGRESEWTPGVGDGQGGLACCDSWGRKESDTTERLNWTEEQLKSWDQWHNHDLLKKLISTTQSSKIIMLIIAVVCGKKIRFLTFLGFPGSSNSKEFACNAGNQDSVSGLGRSSGEGNGNPLQYSCLENPMDRGARQARVHGVAKSQTRLGDFTFTLIFLLKNGYVYVLMLWGKTSQCTV